VHQLFSHSRPHRIAIASLGDKVRLTALPLALATVWLGAAGCAGPQAYVPFEQQSEISAEARWQALETVAKREQWNVVVADPKDHTIVAYSSTANTAGVRDRIRVALFADRTVVETRTEVEDQGLWQNSANRCHGYTFSREKLLAAQVEGSQGNATSPPVPRKSSELAAR
jgi:hypothetical protein